MGCPRLPRIRHRQPTFLAWLRSQIEFGQVANLSRGFYTDCSVNETKREYPRLRGRKCRPHVELTAECKLLSSTPKVSDHLLHFSQEIFGNAESFEWKEIASNGPASFQMIHSGQR